MAKSLSIILLMFTAFNALGQKKFSEGTVVYNVQVLNAEKNTQSNAVCTQLIKGGHYRDDLVSSIGKSTTIFDSREGTGAILKEYGGQKIMIPLVSEQWDTKLSKLSAVQFKLSSESKKILGYACEKAEAVTLDGSTYTVYFTKDLSAENQQMDLQFPQLGGFTLEYTLVKGNTTIVYKATSLNFDPVPIQKYDLPNSGYRILSYEESGKIKGN